VTRHYCQRRIGEKVGKPAVIPPASRVVLVSSREVFQPSNRFSSDPCESRTKATSDASTNKMQGSTELIRGFRPTCAGTAQPNQRSRNLRSFDPPFHDLLTNFVMRV
jgi:hypothetical protein